MKRELMVLVFNNETRPGVVLGVEYTSLIILFKFYPFYNLDFIIILKHFKLFSEVNLYALRQIRSNSPHTLKTRCIMDSPHICQQIESLRRLRLFFVPSSINYYRTDLLFFGFWQPNWEGNFLFAKFFYSWFDSHIVF